MAGLRPRRAGAGGGGDPAERVRQPPPLIRSRIPSGRGATEQPNVTGEGDAPLTGRFWVALAFTAVAAGLFGSGLMYVLFSFQHLAFGSGGDDFQRQVEAASFARRVLALLIAGAFGGPAWYLLRRYTDAGSTDVEEVVWGPGDRLSFGRGLGTGIISEIVVGLGASLGREAAPRLMGAVAADGAGRRLGLSRPQRRLLIACGAGAGLAAVYNVPLAGALFACEVMLGTVAIPCVLPAVACSATATGVAWIYLPDRASYQGIPDFRLTATIAVWAVVAGPVIGLLAAGYIRLIAWVSYHRPTGPASAGAPLVAFGLLGVVGLAYPQLFGNGKDLALEAFRGQGTLVLFLALFALKPLVTALCLGSGATGGLLTPFMSTGAVFGAFAGGLWARMWPGAPVGAFALVAAAAMLGASIQAPLVGLVLVLELTHSGFGLAVPLAVATFLATGVAYRVDGYSIYSARLAARTSPSGVHH